jgi:hypothetical protein
VLVSVQVEKQITNRAYVVIFLKFTGRHMGQNTECVDSVIQRNNFEMFEVQ